MRKGRKAVIFDWGGVLMQTEDRAPRYRWDEQLGLERGQVERTVHGIDAWRAVQRGEVAMAAYEHALRRELNLSEDEVTALLADFYSADRLNENAVSLIRGLRGKSVLVGLLSNNTPDLPDTMRELDVYTLFDAVVISAAIGTMKPDPAPYHAILQELGVEAEDALFIDDFMENIEGARAVGMSALYYTPEIDLRTSITAWLDSDNAGL